jgi:hypothetical protein
MWGARTLDARKPRNAEKICVVDLRGDLTVGFCLEWMWAHECVPRASESRIQARVVEPGDVTEGDADHPECTTCHCGEGQQLYCGPEE